MKKRIRSLLISQVTLQASWNRIRMGQTSARITPSPVDGSIAFVSCGADLCRVRCVSSTSELSIDSIWLTDNHNPAYMQAAVTAVCQLPLYQVAHSTERNLGGFLFGVAGDLLVFSRIESDIHQPGLLPPDSHSFDTRAVLRSLNTYARPSNVIYLNSQRRFVVATIEPREDSCPPNGSRILISRLRLLNAHSDKPVDEVEIKQEDGGGLTDGLLVAEYQLEHAERVYTMVDWQYTDNGKRYSLLIIGTGIHSGPGKPKGRRLIFSLGKSSSRISLQKETNYDAPVYCIAMWDNRTTVTSVGNLISLDAFNSQAGRYVDIYAHIRLALTICRWTRLAKVEVPSPGIYISVKVPYVYISTLSHSHLCYEIKEVEGKCCFEQVFSDSRERSCTHHLVIDLPDVDSSKNDNRLVLLTDKRSASITSLYHPPSRMCRTASTTVFEACLPRTVIRLHRGDIRPPWRRAYHTSKDTVLPSGVYIDDIMGACSDGTMYNFSILSEPAQRVLRLLQNLLEAKQNRDITAQDVAVKRRSGHIYNVLMNGAEGAQNGDIRAYDVDPRRHGHGLGAAKQRHVDGDLLHKWIKEDGNLEELVTAGTEPKVGVLFNEMMRLIGDEWRGTVEPQPGEAQGFYSTVQDWLADIFMPVF